MDTTQITGIEKIGSLGRVNHKPAVPTVAICDELALSASAQKEALKMKRWIELLHKMPEIRREAIEAASSRELPSPLELAKKIASDLTIQR